MKPDKDTRDSIAELRERAEQAVQRGLEEINEVSALSPEETRRLVHDLQVHQIELEMQNEELRRIQAELEDSRDNYADLYDFSPVSYFTLDDAGLIVQVNLTATRLLGLERAFLINTPFLFFVAPESQGAFHFHFKEVFESRTARTCEIELARKDGSRFHARLESAMARNGPGQGLICQTAVSDISDLKQAEDALRTERDNLVNILDAMPDGVYISNQEYDIQYVNSAIERDFGPWRGRKCHEYLHARDVVCPWCHDYEILAGKKGRWERNFSRTGKTYDVIGTPLRNPDGSILKLAIFRDISERKRMEDALRRSEAKYRALIENAQEGIWAVDTEGRTTFVNPRMAEILGYAPEEMLGQPVFTFLAEEARARAGGYLERRRQGLRDQADLQFLRKDGTPVYAAIIGSPIIDDEGQFAGALACVSDITDRKCAEEALQAAHDQLEKRVEERTTALVRANEKLYREVIERKMAEEEIKQLTEELEERVRERTADLEAANRELESFTYSVSHDLRAPLRSITGFSEIIARRHRTHLNEESRHYLENIIKASHHMDRLIDNLLAYSRVGFRAKRRQEIPLRSVLAQVLEDLSDRISQANAEISIPKKLPVVSGDRTVLFQIFANLIDNALAYRRPKVRPKVAISYEKEGDHVVVRVADNGIGIPSECHQKIFNLFQRLHGEDEYPGTGIGLAIVKRSVESLRGRIWLESTVGKGATFCVQLPVPSKNGKQNDAQE
ncbi:MAG: PAS domain S-box protein [Deltaproteobacteria bacterium]